MLQEITKGPWNVSFRRLKGYKYGSVCISGQVGTVVDTEALDVYPLKLADRKALQIVQPAVAALAEVRALLPEEYAVGDQYSALFSGNLIEEIDKLLRHIEPCEACDGSGIRPDLDNGLVLPAPDGFQIIERCDICCRFESDLDAAKVWGTQAHWQCDDEGKRTQAIAVAKAGDE
jgi:hypothetical protein